MTYEELERLKVEADRWIAAVASNGSTSGAASNGIRKLMDKVHIMTVPQGWKLVPERPTEQMLLRLYLPLHVIAEGMHPAKREEMEKHWRAMLDVAPSSDAAVELPSTKE